VREYPSAEHREVRQVNWNEIEILNPLRHPDARSVLPQAADGLEKARPAQSLRNCARAVALYLERMKSRTSS
jgi:hypothetical protein